MPAPLILALLINECRFKRATKIFQSISYLPYFISWVIISGMIFNIASSEGMINSALMSLGLIKEPIDFINEHFWVLLVISDMWKGIGWGAIIYIAALASIAPTLYEAAVIDGASRFRRIISITLPLIVPTIIVILIFSLGGVLNTNFDQIYMLRNNQNYLIAEVIDTHVYTTGIAEARYSYATAVGLFKSVIGFILIYLSNFVAKLISKGEQGVF